MFIPGGVRKELMQAGTISLVILFVQTILVNYRPSKRTALLYCPYVINLTFLSLGMKIECIAIPALLILKQGLHIL